MTSATRVIGTRYRLGSLIGRGGMSDVYQAVDERTGADVAVKVVRSADPALALRMAREARALESLDHPNLVRLLDSGLLGDQAYLVMSFVDGSTLGPRLARGPMQPAEVAALGVAVADGLAYIHERGIVHRDIKPANILIARDGQVQLADFGVARFSDASTLTLAGTTLGTVAYMAPEQLEDHQVGPSADIWSLGVVLLECLTGRRLYEGSPSEVIARRLAEPVPIPADLPVPWQQLLGRMLERSPDPRPAAGEVGNLLRTAAFATPRDPWGPPLSRDGQETVKMDSMAGADRTVVYGPEDAGVAGEVAARLGRRPQRFRGRSLVALGALAAAILVAVLVLDGSGAPAPARAKSPPVATTSGPATPVAAATPTAADTLAALNQAVSAGIAAGTLRADQGGALTTQAGQAFTDAGAGRPAPAANDLQQAAQTIATGARDGSIATREATLLQADLATLASRLGLAGASTPPVTPAPPPAHGPHKGGGGDGGDGGPAGKGG